MYLEHYGIKGQHWGVRNGPPYPISKKNTILFVSGSSHTQTKKDPYYRKDLNKDIKKELDDAISNNKTIIVGDAPGIDRQVQDYLKKKKYSNVEVYGPGNGDRWLKEFLNE